MKRQLRDGIYGQLEQQQLSVGELTWQCRKTSRTAIRPKSATDAAKQDYIKREIQTSRAHTTERQSDTYLREKAVTASRVSMKLPSKMPG